MATKTLYVGDRDGPLWEAAQRVADRRRTSLSRLVTEALERHLPDLVDAPEPPPTDRWNDLAADAA